LNFISRSETVCGFESLEKSIQDFNLGWISTLLAVSMRVLTNAKSNVLRGEAVR